MAKAEKGTRPVTAREECVFLELSIAEARALYAAYARIGGSETRSPRKHIKSIGAALANVLEMDYRDTPEWECSDRWPGGQAFGFSDYPGGNPDAYR